MKISAGVVSQILLAVSLESQKHNILKALKY
jgi:hypothetical protein